MAHLAVIKRRCLFLSRSRPLLPIPMVTRGTFVFESALAIPTATSLQGKTENSCLSSTLREELLFLDPLTAQEEESTLSLLTGRFESDLTILYQVSAFHTLPELNTYPFDLSLVSYPFLISKMVGEVGTNTGTFQSHISRRYSKRVIHHHESLYSARYTTHIDLEQGRESWILW
jgi:hypothetical protein